MVNIWRRCAGAKRGGLAAPLVEALELGRVPRPLDGVLANV
jgi:hypothetical protein